MIEAIRSHQPELSGIHFSFNDRYFHSSSFSSPVHKRRLESSGYHLVKRSQTCSINSLGQAFTCPDNYHCTGDNSCDRDDSWYDHDGWGWWGGAIGGVVVVALVILIFVRRRRIQRQQEALGQLSVVVPGYGNEEQYGYPIAMEPLRQPAAVYPGATGVLYAPPTTPPPRLPASSPVFAAAAAVPASQVDLYEASGSSSLSSSAPPRYSPPQDSHDPSMMNGRRKN